VAGLDEEADLPLEQLLARYGNYHLAAHAGGWRGCLGGSRLLSECLAGPWVGPALCRYMCVSFSCAACHKSSSLTALPCRSGQPLVLQCIAETCCNLLLLCVCHAV
jgi:hypothetical protein